ncbi:hypothetical protein HZH66_002996 [Vespula vulgaris]|uniref:Uncharacterized protein n=1 Tax=Vespula vulgaris TaxID=7454 RepID=A0A834KI83_VESVU|nr:hypothetical protein HZH66_002996 [Vespula vulgaris]
MGDETTKLEILWGMEKEKDGCTATVVGITAHGGGCGGDGGDVGSQQDGSQGTRPKNFAQTHLEDFTTFGCGIK